MAGAQALVEGPTLADKLRDARNRVTVTRAMVRQAEDHERAAKAEATALLAKESEQQTVAAQDRYAAANLMNADAYTGALRTLRANQQTHDEAQAHLDSLLDERRQLEYEMAVENKGVQIVFDPEALGLLQRHVQMMGYLGEAARRPR